MPYLSSTLPYLLQDSADLARVSLPDFQDIRAREFLVRNCLGVAQGESCPDQSAQGEFDAATSVGAVVYHSYKAIKEQRCGEGRRDGLALVPPSRPQAEEAQGLGLKGVSPAARAQASSDCKSGGEERRDTSKAITHICAEQFGSLVYGRPRAHYIQEGTSVQGGEMDSLNYRTEVGGSCWHNYLVSTADVCRTEAQQAFRQPRRSVCDVVRTVIAAPAVVSGLGSVVVTLPISKLNAFGFLLTTALSAYNEVRMQSQNVQSEQLSTQARPLNRYVAYLREKFLSPGFCTWVQAGLFVANTAVALFNGHFITAAVMGAFTVGELAATAIANRDYKTPRREPLAFERLADRAWGSLPERVKVVLSDPGAMFCPGNLVLVLKDLDADKLSNFNLLVTGIGCIFAAGGVLRGFKPLWGQQPKPSGNAAVLGGVGDQFLGVSSILTANIYTGCATMLWGVGNIIYGKRMGASLLSSLISKKSKGN
jgi:hypothetical protein